MNFTNIPAFENRMTQQGVEISFFTIIYGANRCEIECAYSISQKKFIFGFVNANIGFTITLDGINATTNLEGRISTKLAECRDGSSDWKPSHFFDILNNHLPNVTFAQITRGQYIGIYTAASAFEDRIFFNHWRRSGMSPEQAEKTQSLLGRQVLDFCRANRIIPVFYPNPTDRTFNVAKDYLLDHQTHGFNQNP
ncbi:MAG: hypothetical protein NTW78_06085 [Campylobacterales bacterium]|nr:hypothetical protein [Campylobacterales bacterium]